MVERAEKQAGSRPGTGGSAPGWLRRVLGLLANSRSETPWRSDIDFQEMARDLVESARKKEVADDSPPTVEQVVATLATVNGPAPAAPQLQVRDTPCE